MNDRAYDTVKKILRLNPFGEYLFQDEKTHKRVTENGFNHKPGQYYYYSNQSNDEKLGQLNRACIV